VNRTTDASGPWEAGHADNALPQSARAVINCRVFPGDTLEFVRTTLADMLGDPEIRLTPMGGFRPSPMSPLVPEVMDAVDRLTKEMWPGVVVLPVMDPWSGDSAPLRMAGVTTLGVSGTFSGDSDNAHGANERLGVEAFYDSVEFLYRLMKALTGGGPAASR
jgi:acetylornithine deacetylase/succinyl-diaminopimelate desuccinylase-like protein